MRVLILYTVVLLTCAKNVKLTPIENNEVPVDSISVADDKELDSDLVDEVIQPFNQDEQLDEMEKLDQSDVDTNEGALDDESDASNNDEAQEEIDRKEKLYGVEIPICAQYAEVTYPLHVSHLTDCGKFYKCSNGRGYLFDCPAEQHWSVKFDRCDYPQIAGCTIDGTHQFKLQKQARPKQASDSDDDDDEDKAFDDSEVDPRCDGIDPSTPVHFTHPNDCSKYYKCYMGITYVINCPKGLHWGERLNRCEHPSIAHCNSAIKPDELPMDEDEIDEEDEKINSIIYDADYIIRDVRCMSDGIDRYHPIQFSHPSDCQMFYKCFDGFAFKVICPGGLHFDVKKQECDYPDIAKCEAVDDTPYA